MRIVERIAEVRELQGRRVGFVPTMGAFHEGHLQLMRRARQENDVVVVSLFVNPTQFGKNEDFNKYPRDLERDAKLASSVGVDILFAPSTDEVYPRESSTIRVPDITERWEGVHRPGHFDGVATVVCKLFNIVRPTVAYFGLKDLQQCMVIRRMVEDLNMPIQLSFEPTVRESDGLAMSSRNVYLSADEREKAPMLYRELTRCRDVAMAGAESLEEELDESRRKLRDVGFVIDYFACVRLPDMLPIDRRAEESAMIVAAKLGTTRLIDNVVF